MIHKCETPEPFNNAINNSAPLYWLQMKIPSCTFAHIDLIVMIAIPDDKLQ